MRGRSKSKGPGLTPRPFSSRSRGFALGVVVGPYLAVDLLDEGLAVLVLLLELPNLLKLFGGKAFDSPGNLLDGQRIVVGGPKRAQHGGPKLRLAGGLFGLPEDVLGPLGGLLGYPKALTGGLLGGPKPLPCYLLGCLEALLGGPLEGTHALLSVGEGAEEVAVGTDPTLGKSPHALLLAAHAPREGLGGTRVLLGLLTHDLDGLAHPLLYELGVLLLELEEPYAVGEELLGGLGVLLLEPHELQPAFGKPNGAALGGGEVLGYGFEGVALGLGHLLGGARRLVDVPSSGSHFVTSVVDSNCLLLCSYHTYVRCQILRRSALPIAHIHPSAWKGHSPKFAAQDSREAAWPHVLDTSFSNFGSPVTSVSPHAVKLGF